MQVASSHCALPHLAGSRPELRLGHLAIYGGTYYSYLYARCLASHIWTASGLAANPLDPAAGAASITYNGPAGAGSQPCVAINIYAARHGRMHVRPAWLQAPAAPFRFVVMTSFAPAIRASDPLQATHHFMYILLSWNVQATMCGAPCWHLAAALSRWSSYQGRWLHGMGAVQGTAVQPQA